jgi:hypothetical protein
MTRADVTTAFYDELSTAATGTFTAEYAGGDQQFTVADSDVTLADPSMLEDLPAVVYTTSDTQRQVNGVGIGQVGARLTDGAVEYYIFREYRTLSASVIIGADNEVQLDALYESIHRQFGQYAFGPWDETDVHPNIDDITVLETTEQDAGDEKETVRVESLTVEINYYRDYELTGDTIETFEAEIDSDLDSATNGDVLTIDS